MNWLDLHKPKKLFEIKHNKNEINKAITWIESYKKNYKETKKVLLIIGNSGIGKTLLANILLKEYLYQKIELNSTDVRSQKKINDFLIKSLTYKNVIDMFYDGNAPIGILLDEIDTICKLNDKGGFTEFLNILKQNEKCEKLKKSKISIENYIKLYNPIICTSNNTNDKKINELKKFAEVIYLKKPTNKEIFEIIEEIYNLYNIQIDDELKLEITNYSQGDIRQLIINLENLYLFSNEKKITKDIFQEFINSQKKKEENIQLLESTRLLISKKNNIKECQLYFDIDCLLTPLMIYHNSINYIKNTEDKNNKKLKIYRNVLNSLSIHDTIQTNIFEVQDWDELYDYAGFYGCVLPNYYFNELKNKKDITIEFTSLLNKISQMYVNKKLLNSAKNSTGKIICDSDELIYLTEIISYYFDNYMENENDFEEITQESNEDENNVIVNNNSDLIKFMNKYKINVDGLENILKIEKLNQNNEKRKKKFTLKVKKKISKYIIL